MSLGRADDWSLTKQTFAGIESELNDHVACLRDEQGDVAAQLALDSAGSAKARRRLAGPHIAEQVYVTLHRRPTREEWTELGVLLLWFGLIMLGDWLAAKAHPGMLPTGQRHPLFIFDRLTTETLAWLLHGIARAGFFASLAHYLYRAWQRGGGVLIARLIQLKLLHTVLVVWILIVLGQMLWESNFWPGYTPVNWPTWLNAVNILIAMVTTAGLVLALSRTRLWAPALFLLLVGAFLYSGAPVPLYEVTSWSTLALEKVGKGEWIEETDVGKIEQRADEINSRNHEGIYAYPDMNRVYFTSEVAAPYPATYWYWNFRKTGGELAQLDLADPAHGSILAAVHRGSSRRPLTYLPITNNPKLTQPLAMPGGGIGWLAAPIPILGFAGLFGLLLVMGRRSVADMTVYTLLLIVALASTLLPFTFGMEFSDMFALNARGMVGGPVPGFEQLLLGRLDELWLIFFGLLLSAGVPWLLAALFLKPGSGSAPPDLVAE